MHVTSGANMWVKTTEKTSKNAFHELSQMSKTVRTLKAEKEYNDANLLFHKHKNSGAQ